MDVSIPKNQRIWIGTEKEGYWQEVVFENIPLYCNFCKKIGHEENVCYIKNPDLKGLVKNTEGKNKSQSEVVKEKGKEKTQVSWNRKTTANGKKGEAEWQVVKRKSRNSEAEKENGTHSGPTAESLVEEPLTQKTKDCPALHPVLHQHQTGIYLTPFNVSKSKESVKYQALTNQKETASQPLFSSPRTMAPSEEDGHSIIQFSQGILENDLRVGSILSCDHRISEGLARDLSKANEASVSVLVCSQKDVGSTSLNLNKTAEVFLTPFNPKIFPPNPKDSTNSHKQTTQNSTILFPTPVSSGKQKATCQTLVLPSPPKVLRCCQDSVGKRDSSSSSQPSAGVNSQDEVLHSNLSHPVNLKEAFLSNQKVDNSRDGAVSVNLGLCETVGTKEADTQFSTPIAEVGLGEEGQIVSGPTFQQQKDLAEAGPSPEFGLQKMGLLVRLASQSDLGAELHVPISPGGLQQGCEGLVNAESLGLTIGLENFLDESIVGQSLKSYHFQEDSSSSRPKHILLINEEGQTCSNPNPITPSDSIVLESSDKVFLDKVDWNKVQPRRSRRQAKKTRFFEI